MKLPTHDPKTDGNRFEWILEQSKLLRKKSMEAVADASRPALFCADEQRIIEAHDAAVESEETERFQRMRAFYGRKRTVEVAQEKMTQAIESAQQEPGL